MRRLGLFSIVLLTACTYRAELGERALESEVPAELDLLFVIDDSGSMQEEQTALTEAFSALMDELEQAPGGMPSLHLGVISTDLGTGGYPIAMCDKSDGGALLTAPHVSGCEPPTGDFIADLPHPEGGRERNYTGTLTEAFTCIALLGTGGCGYEQPLEAMRLALSGADGLNPCELGGGTCYPGELACSAPAGVLDPNPCGETEELMTCCAGDIPVPDNQGFRRSEAVLAVVIISDEDDCSASDPTLFDTASTELDDPLGPLSSFRCVEYGVSCDGGDVARESATYESCAPRADSPYVAHPDDYVSFLSELGGEDTVVSVIAGPSTELEVVLETEVNNLRTEPTCESENGTACGAYRLAYFAEQFEYGTFSSICAGEYGTALSETGRKIRTVIENGTAVIPDPDDPDDPEDPDREPGGCAASPHSNGPGTAWLLVLLGLGAFRRHHR